MRVVVTGAAGFIGSHVAEVLAAENHDVLALDDLSGGFEENVPTGCRFEKRSRPIPRATERPAPIEILDELPSFWAERLGRR